MIIFTIIGQRIERYLGEYAPEVLDAADEYVYGEEPEIWAKEQIDKWVATKEFENVVCVQVLVDSKSIMARLRPSKIPIKGELVQE